MDTFLDALDESVVVEHLRGLRCEVVIPCIASGGMLSDAAAVRKLREWTEGRVRVLDAAYPDPILFAAAAEMAILTAAAALEAATAYDADPEDPAIGEWVAEFNRTGRCVEAMIRLMGFIECEADEPRRIGHFLTRFSTRLLQSVERYRKAAPVLVAATIDHALRTAPRMMIDAELRRAYEALDRPLGPAGIGAIAVEVRAMRGILYLPPSV